MPFKSDKQRKFMFAKHPKIAKKWAGKYRYGGTIGTGESVGGTSSNGTENKHVFNDGGIADARYGELGQIKNPDGSISTEYSITEYVPELGGYVNIPTLVKGQKKFKEMLKSIFITSMPRLTISDWLKIK